MLGMLVLWLASSFCLYMTAMVVPGFKIHSFPSALIAAIVVGLLNMLLRPLLIFLTLPINILTLGLFTFVVNAMILRLSAGVLRGFDINGWIPAIVGAMVLAIIQTLVHWIFGGQYVY